MSPMGPLETADDGFEFRDVDKRYGARRALDGVSVAIGRGLTGLLGPNGAGKTTLLRMAATVLAPDRGSLRVLGDDPGDAAGRRRIRRRLGYMPQEPGFYRGFTVREFVDYVALLREMVDKTTRGVEVSRVIDLVGLEAQATTRIRSLSGGMRRRLALAVALLGDPAVLLLDEPTAGLDPEQQLRFRALVSQLPQRPAVVLSTHQTSDVVALCERVVVLTGGVVRFDGTPAELAATASGRVWVDGAQDPAAALSWRTGDGSYRHIGDPPAGAAIAAATIDDAYLLMVRSTGA